MASRLRTLRLARPALIRPRNTPVALRRHYAATAGSEQPFFPDEPKGPTLQTEIPGPESKKAIAKLEHVFDTRSLNMMADYRHSYGN